MLLPPKRLARQMSEACSAKLSPPGGSADLRWPDFSDFRAQVQSFYEPSNFGMAWVRDHQPTAQARTMIEVLQRAESKGLNAEDYDASRWSSRLTQLNDPAAAARFDVASTICAMRYISALEVGRVNPSHLKFGLTTKSTQSELPQFLRDRIANGQDIEASLAEIEPPSPVQAHAGRVAALPGIVRPG